jgi:hypothetical protein
VILALTLRFPCLLVWQPASASSSSSAAASQRDVFQFELQRSEVSDLLNTVDAIQQAIAHAAASSPSSSSSSSTAAAPALNVDAL